MSPARSRKQQRAAGADLARKRKGKKLRTFVGASTKTLRKFAKKG